MDFTTRNLVRYHARGAARTPRTAREGARKSSLQDRLCDIGKCIELRAVERRAGLGVRPRKRRVRKEQHRNEKRGRDLTPAESTEEVTNDSRSLDQCKLVTDTAEERPMYWKLLQHVLANLGITEEEWRLMYVGQ